MPLSQFQPHQRISSSNPISAPPPSGPTVTNVTDSTPNSCQRAPRAHTHLHTHEIIRSGYLWKEPVRKSVFGGSKQKRWMVLSDHTVLSDHMLALEPRIVFHAVSAILIPTDSPF